MKGDVLMIYSETHTHYETVVQEVKSDWESIQRFSFHTASMRRVHKAEAGQNPAFACSHSFGAMYRMTTLVFKIVCTFLWPFLQLHIC